MIVRGRSLKGYSVTFSSSAKKSLKKFDKRLAEQINKGLARLVDGDPSVDVKKMQGQEELYRLRIGDYRIIYEVHHHVIIVHVVKIGHRKDVYGNI